MIPPAVSRVVAVQPLLDAIERDQGNPGRAPFDNLRVGQAVVGRVLSQTRDMALVSIEGHTVSMRLPRPVERGDTLKLSFAGHQPQPSFLLETPGATPAAEPDISPTARMLSDIMQRVPERTLPTLAPAAPLLAQPADTATLAPALRTALVRSGLFYESHLANWVAGSDSLEGLLQEPQNRLSAETGRAIAADPGQKAPSPLHTLLTQQLQVLESPQFVWRGELWPGQALEWQLRRGPESADDEPAHSPAPSAEAAWESRLKLHLPTLGEVEVDIRLDARQSFSIRVRPASAATLPLLRNQQSALATRLQDAGCALRALEIVHDAAA